MKAPQWVSKRRCLSKVALSFQVSRFNVSKLLDSVIKACMLNQGCTFLFEVLIKGCTVLSSFAFKCIKVAYFCYQGLHVESRLHIFVWGAYQRLHCPFKFCISMYQSCLFLLSRLVCWIKVAHFCLRCLSKVALSFQVLHLNVSKLLISVIKACMLNQGCTFLSLKVAHCSYQWLHFFMLIILSSKVAHFVVTCCLYVLSFQLHWKHHWISIISCSVVVNYYK